jgi:hypothetical protein
MCKDGDLQLAVLSGLGLPSDTIGAKDSREIASTCWDSMKDSVRKHLQDHKTGYFRDNACAILKAKGEVCETSSTGR